MRSCIPLLLLAATLPAAAASAARPPAGIIRGIYADPGAAIENRVWTGYGAGYVEDTAEKHSGTASIRCTNRSDREAHGASQRIRLAQETARPIIISGWAKLEGVAGEPNYRCSVYLDLVLEGGEPWLMKVATFDPAKSGWQYAEATYTPPAPIESATVYVFLRERQGTAWFDDLAVQEVLDAQGTRSANLLQDPGFEAKAPPRSGETGGASLSPRDRFFGKLKEIGCNAFHLYRGVSWEKVMGEPGQPAGPLPAIDPEDPFLDFVRDAHRRGFKVWLTVGVGLPPLENAQSPEFPFWACVNNRWGEAYTRAIAYFAQYGVDGIGMVPDEWNYHNEPVKSLANHSDPAVAQFYTSIPHHCDCPVCRTRFRERTGQEYPDVRNLWSTTAPVWADYLQFRYDSTAAWIRRSVQAAKRVNPRIVTDTMICVIPVCSDDRRDTGAAWDQIGVETGLDCLQTDPYIQLHNYLGDSTHYYPAETTLHLASANWKGRAGVTLEACRLFERYRDKEPVEVYGSALSCLAHGAREFFWWYFSYLNGEERFVDPEPPSRQLAAVYRVMREMEPYLLEARTPGEVLVLYSRTSEDIWHWLAGTPSPPAIVGAKPDPRRGFQAHRNVLYWLLRRGIPFRMTFLENPDPARLREARVILVPFAPALSSAHLQTIRAQLQAGKTVVTLGPLATMDERGVPTTRSLGAPGRGPLAATKGKLIHLGDDFSTKLFPELPPMRDPKGTVPLPPFVPGPTARLEQVLAGVLGRPASLFAAQPARDVEATLLRGPRGRLLLLTNWNPRRPAQVALRQSAVGGPARAQGFAISRAATVKPVRMELSGAGWRFRLAPQESRLVRLSPIQR